MRYFLLSALFLPLSVLAADMTDFNAGNQAFKDKDYSVAKEHYIKCVNKLSGCITQMGVVNYLEGNKEEAIGWFKLAAKVGDEAAIKNLRILGEIKPAPTATPEKTEMSVGEVLGTIGRGVSHGSRKSMRCDSIVIGEMIDTTCR